MVPDDQTDLPEGAAVTVLADVGDKEFDVPPDLAADLAEAMEAERGDVVSKRAVLARLRG